MPVFKNEDNGTWYVMARYVNWKGERKQKCKRGFATKREAQEWERMFKLQTSSDLDMSFEAFAELYINDVKNRLKENTWLTKEHMDEATPHLHIDFVPFTTGSKRGLDTRVSLKQALATQGFKGGSRGDTEWSQWVQSEKEQLAAVMERYGIEWEHKGTHEKHLSVLDYKKQEREKEVAVLGAKIEQKQVELESLSNRVLNYDKAKDELSNLEFELDTAPKYQLPEPEKFMSAKAYKVKMAEPVVRKLKELVKTVLARCFEGWDNYHRLNTANAQLYRTNQRLEKVNERLTEENARLKAENKDYSLLCKVFGRKQIDDLLEQARTIKGRKRDNSRSRYVVKI